MMNRLLGKKCRFIASPSFAPSRSRLKSGFTLIELLVVVSVLILLLAITTASFNYTIGADRVRSAARQYQSFVAGARDKAINANDIRGVRLLLDPNDNHAVTGMQYIGSPQQETGFLKFNVPPTLVDTTGKTVSYVSGTPWSSLKRRGFLRVGSRIQIPSESGSWYTIAAINPPITGTDLILTLNQPNTSLALSTSQVSYTLELGPGPLGDAQPVLFPRGVVVDLDGSVVPGAWRPATFDKSYPNQMDILFSPRGTVLGEAASVGMLHLHFADVSDVVKWHANASLAGRANGSYAASSLPIVPVNNMNAAPPIITVTKDRVVASLSSRNGAVSVHYIYEGLTPGDVTTIAAPDPYSFAETGQVANK